MSTGIEWTDETWNPVVGCTKVSQGCKNCYAKQLHDQRHKAHLAGKTVAPQYAEPFELVQLKSERLVWPIGWRRPRRIFVNSVSDLFHEDVPFSYIDQVLAVVALTPRHTYQVLTKRPERMVEYFDHYFTRHKVAAAASKFSCVYDGELGTCDLSVCNAPFPLPNLWLGTSVEHQDAANERIPLLLKTPATIRFISAEPLLEEIYVGQWLTCRERNDPQFEIGHGIDWVIVGGESGPRARPFDIQWAYSLVDQVTSDVRVRTKVFVKQLGAHVMNAEGMVDVFGPGARFNDDRVMLHDHHGGDMAEWPEPLRIRAFPVVQP